MAGFASKGVVASLLFEMKSWARYILPTKYVAVYYPTPDSVIERMLNLSNVQASDVVVDLGSGDGRVLIAAAQRGARGVGYELDAELVQASLHNIRSRGLEHAVRIIHGDASKADVSDATIIALYLSDKGNRKLVQAISPTLRPGTRLVSNFFSIEGWDQYLVKTCTADPKTGPIHLYRSPDISHTH